jgi:hypothetical protein
VALQFGAKTKQGGKIMNDIRWWGFKGYYTDNKMVTCVEKILDITFPIDYVECIRKYPEGSPSPDEFKTKKATTYAGTKNGEFGYFFGFNPESKNFILNHYFILNSRSGNSNKLPDKIVPFATADGNDDSLCFDYRDGYPPTIVLFDLVKHWEYLDRIESGEQTEDEEDYLIFVSDSFSGLLEMLTESPDE